MEHKKRLDIASRYIDSTGRYDLFKSEKRRQLLFKENNQKNKDHKGNKDRAYLHNRNPIYAPSYDFRSYAAQKINLRSRNSLKLFERLGFTY